MSSSRSTAPAAAPDQKASARRLISITVLVATMGALAFGYDTGIIAPRGW